MEPCTSEIEIDRIWQQYVKQGLERGVCSAAIASIFQDARISGQTRQAA